MSAPPLLKRHKTAAAAVGLLLAGVLWPGAMACDQRDRCDRDGCNAVEKPVADEGHASIAGVSALESDVIANGCQSCPFSATPFSLWAVSAPVNDAASANTVVHSGRATIAVWSDGHYRQDLDPGDYLLCLDYYCVNVNVISGHTTPVNVLHPFGAPQFRLFDPLTHAPQVATTFTVSP